MRLEECGHRFRNTFQAKDCYIHRKIGDSDVLICIGQNIADFNGYIELNATAALLWETLQEPSTVSIWNKSWNQTMTFLTNKPKKISLTF
mgnify:CR=1 FL=1